MKIYRKEIKMGIFTKYSILAVALSAIFGCATKLTDGAKRVRIIENPEIVKHCDFLGPIDNSHYTGWNPEDNVAQATNAARNAAAEMGGNVMRITGSLFRGVRADVYKCEF